MKEHPLNRRALLWTTRPPWWSSPKPSPSLHRKWWVVPSARLSVCPVTGQMRFRDVNVDELCPLCDRWLSRWPALKSLAALLLRWLWTMCSWLTKDVLLQPLQSQRRLETGLCPVSYMGIITFYKEQYIFTLCCISLLKFLIEPSKNIPG